MSLKPLFSRCARMRPALLPANASGLMIVRVRLEDMNCSGEWEVGRDAGLLESRLDEVDEIDRPLGDAHSGGLERLDLPRRRARRSGNDRARVAHPAARRCGLSGDESDDGLRHVLLDERRGLLLVGAADLAHHRDGLRLRILLERGEAVDEIRAVDGIAADSDARRLPDAGARELVDDLIGERARTAHDADVALRADPTGDDSDLALARRDEPRAIRPEQPYAALLPERIDPRHVEHGYALGD